MTCSLPENTVAAASSMLLLSSRTKTSRPKTVRTGLSTNSSSPLAAVESLRAGSGFENVEEYRVTARCANRDAASTNRSNRQLPTAEAAGLSADSRTLDTNASDATSGAFTVIVPNFRAY